MKTEAQQLLYQALNNGDNVNFISKLVSESDFTNCVLMVGDKGEYKFEPILIELQSFADLLDSNLSLDFEMELRYHDLTQVTGNTVPGKGHYVVLVIKVKEDQIKNLLKGLIPGVANLETLEEYFKLMKIQLNVSYHVLEKGDGSLTNYFFWKLD